MPEDVKISQPPKRRAPTLYVIIVGKLIKGTLAVGLALFIFKLAGQDLSDAFDQLGPMVSSRSGKSVFFGDW